MASAALEQNYSGVFDGRLPPGEHPALLIVDMVMAYSEPGSPLRLDGAAAAAATARLADIARATGAPVIFTNVVYRAGGIDGGLFYRKIPVLRVFDEGSSLGEFLPELQPQPGELVVSKQYASAFFGTSLASTLRALNIDSLLITGYSTSGCVRATALDALQSGFAPFVVRDGCADRHPGPHEANLFDLQSKYAEVIDEATATALLQR